MAKISDRIRLPDGKSTYFIPGGPRGIPKHQVHCPLLPFCLTYTRIFFTREGPTYNNLYGDVESVLTNLFICPMS